MPSPVISLIASPWKKTKQTVRPSGQRRGTLQIREAETPAVDVPSLIVPMTIPPIPSMFAPVLIPIAGTSSTQFVPVICKINFFCCSCFTSVTSIKY